jgi:hypothetical protein
MNRDFKEMLSELSAAGVEYLLVGAHALAAHGHVRATKDLDIWIHASDDNAPRVLRALRQFGAPTEGLEQGDFSAPGFVFQVGVAPVRIDILTEIDGVTFEEAWSRRTVRTVGGLDVPVLSLEDLLRNKRSTGRLEDLADAEALERLSRG